MTNYKKDLEIDEQSLDLEWLRQPNLYMEYAEQLVEAKMEEADVKNRLEVVTAELDNRVRNDPNLTGSSKVTEAGIKNWIIVQLEYQEALKEHNEVKNKVMLLEAAVKALEHRKKALENLVILLNAKYFAAPKEPRDISREKERMSEITKTIKTQRKRTSRKGRE